MVWAVYQRPILVEGSVGTIIYLLKTKKKKRKRGKNEKKILEHPFGREDGSRSSLWSCY